jgi:hypothetical protein
VLRNDTRGLPTFPFDPDPDPAVHFDADPVHALHFDANPDPPSQNNADPDPQCWFYSRSTFHMIVAYMYSAALAIYLSQGAGTGKWRAEGV